MLLSRPLCRSHTGCTGPRRGKPVHTLRERGVRGASSGHGGGSSSEALAPFELLETVVSSTSSLHCPAPSRHRHSHDDTGPLKWPAHRHLAAQGSTWSTGPRWHGGPSGLPTRSHTTPVRVRARRSICDGPGGQRPHVRHSQGGAGGSASSGSHHRPRTATSTSSQVLVHIRRVRSRWAP